MAHKKRKIPKLIVSKNAFSRFLEKNYGYTHVRQFTAPQKFSSRLNSIFIAKDAEGRDVFIKACRYGDMCENEYKCSLELWKQAPDNFAKPLAFYSGRRFSFCSAEFISGEDFRTITMRGDELTAEQKARIVEDLYAIGQALLKSGIVHRDVAAKNMLYHNGRVVLIDCQLATRRDNTKPITLFDNILKICMGRWGSKPGPSLLDCDDFLGLADMLQTIGCSPENKQRFDAVCSELQAVRGQFKYVFPYPGMSELNHYIRVCQLRRFLHPKSKLRARYGLVLAQLQYLKAHHPDAK